MRKLILVLAAVVCLGVAGCIRQPQQVFTVTTAFDKEMAEHQLRPGKNTIKGSALLRQQGGGVVTGAGMRVQLIPFTTYAQERLSKIYGSDEQGILRVGFQGLPERVISTPKAPGYEEAMKYTIADAQGYFTFKNLADGTYYMISPVIWRVGHQEQGGILMKKVHVSGGETQEVVLTY